MNAQKYGEPESAHRNIEALIRIDTDNGSIFWRFTSRQKAYRICGAIQRMMKETDRTKLVTSAIRDQDFEGTNPDHIDTTDMDKGKSGVGFGDVEFTTSAIRAVEINGVYVVCPGCRNTLVDNMPGHFIDENEACWDGLIQGSDPRCED